jgi:hypothetical protein
MNMSCSRYYRHAAEDEVILGLFAPSSRYKARRVTRLLQLKRSRHRIVTAQINHLVQQGRLLHLPSLLIRYAQPFYALPSPVETPPPPPSVAPAPSEVASTGDPSLQCLYCQSAHPAVVCLPCRHQRCCVSCWNQVEKRERSVLSKNQRPQHQLSTASPQRRPTFRPRCPRLPRGGGGRLANLHGLTSVTQLERR